jgi:hypothetical protein
VCARELEASRREKKVARREEALTQREALTTEYQAKLNALDQTLEAQRAQQVKAVERMRKWEQELEAKARDAALAEENLKAKEQSLDRREADFPAETPKTHLSGFSFVRVARSLSKTRVKSSTKVNPLLVLTTMSSTYTSTLSLIRSPKVLLIAHTNVGKAFSDRKASQHNNRAHPRLQKRYASYFV